jgi:hypothetical protein
VALGFIGTSGVVWWFRCPLLAKGGIVIRGVAVIAVS